MAGVDCRFAGRLNDATLRTARGGIPFVHLWDTEAQATLHHGGGAPRLLVSAARNGWHLQGRSDAGDDGPLRAGRGLWLTEGVAVVRGTELRILGARPGEALVAPHGHVFQTREGFRLATAVERWLPCRDLELTWRAPGGDDGRQDRVELGLPEEPQRRSIAPTTETSLSLRPGGAPFLHLLPRSYPMDVAVLSQQSGATRVLVEDWTGAVAVGWLPTAVLTEHQPLGSGGLGAREDFGTGDLCTAPVRLPLQVTRGEPGEPVGWIDAGTPFVRLQELGGGVFSLVPQATHVVRPTRGVTWLARTPAPLPCTPGRQR